MIQIDNLILRIPGISKDEGRLIAGMVAQRLADHSISLKEDHMIDNLHLQMTVHEGMGSNELAVMITEQIYTQIIPGRSSV